ncbi:hypothetical protein HHI36_014650 [Cryptolaemus montrouzieri]|uniref:AAA+ ATPase domain-containing protein n=1 Tax=Cryptolaemus montrouzieri TaxID=559131 RepID=A0ABD2N375_9CUCU
MSDYPNSDEEFDIQHQDELELLNDDFDEPILNVGKNSKSRRSLDYGESENSSIIKTQSDLFSTQSQVNVRNESTQDISFNDDFQPIPDTEESTSNSTRRIISTPSSTQPNTEPPRKRTIEELFGDIDDLLFENERKLKKSKPINKYEEQLEMIEKILELRKLNQENKDVLFRQKNSLISSEERNKMNLSWRVPSYPFISITRNDSEKINTQYEESTRSIEETPMEIDRIEEDQNLWVDLYRPRRYLELLSDEMTNRVLLKWLKLWDKVVFNRRPKIRPPKPVDGNQKNKFNYVNHLENQLKLADDGRPHYKVALLCGRPGLGKTTLAHVVARHAGYNVIEINASDDRSLEAFRTSLENATQMRSVIDKQNRPNCVVFDEIDGAPTQSIEFLTKFIVGTITKGKKKGQVNAGVLKRPIICICNDAYVPALRSLRQIAFIVNFPPTSSERLSERLMQIAKKQDLKTDLGAMLALAEKSNNDIRSCLGVLHFFKAQKKRVTVSDVYKSSVGQKDMQQGLFSVWTDIFTRKKAKLKPLGMEHGVEDQQDCDGSSKMRMQKIQKVVQSFGDYERLAQGVFENFPEVNVQGSSLNGICHALDWFCYSDKLNQYILSQQNYSLSSYLPYAFVVWHFRFSSFTFPTIKYPSKGYEVRQKLTNNLATIKQLEKGIQPKIKIFVNPKNLILDVLPPLSKIITPLLRPVNFHLFTVEEKKTFYRVVEIMIDYNFNYIQEKNAVGFYDFNLDPDITPIVTYPVLTTQNRTSISYFVKQMISREVELGKIRRLQVGSDVTENEMKFVHKVEYSPQEDKQLPNHLQKLKVKSLRKVETVVAKDFFGRIITKTDDQETDPKGPQINEDIWFQYKEGFSNAVRKKIKISSLM